MHREGRTGILFAARGDLVVAEDLVDLRVSRDERETKIAAGQELIIGIGVPEAGEVFVTMPGLDHVCRCVGLTVLTHISVTIAFEIAGIVELDADGEVVEAAAAAIDAWAGVPGYFVEGNDLVDLARAVYHDMGRHFRRGVGQPVSGAFAAGAGGVVDDDGVGAGDVLLGDRFQFVGGGGD